MLASRAFTCFFCQGFVVLGFGCDNPRTEHIEELPGKTPAVPSGIVHSTRFGTACTVVGWVTWTSWDTPGVKKPSRKSIAQVPSASVTWEDPVVTLSTAIVVPLSPSCGRL